MADKKPSSRKKPVSQKRVAVVLASLVGTLTFSAGILLLMEGGAVATPASALAYQQGSIAVQVEPTTPLRTGAWNYIIIYESGDSAGSAASLADGRFNGESETTRTVRPKANFHFVIDSARSGRDAVDGQLEVGNAWLNQEVGAPYAGWPDVRYHQVSPYNNAVGVCLIGNLGREPISDAQHQNLLHVVHELQTRLNVPRERILFQWELEPNLKRVNSGQKAYAESFRASLESSLPQ
jgi:hypothetical protein